MTAGAQARPQQAQMGPGRGGPMAGLAVPGAKTKDFKGSLKRLLTVLRPDRVVIGMVILMASASVALAVMGPKLLGNATTSVFNGVIGSMLPAGVEKAQIVAGLRAKGQGDFADMIAGMDVVPGQGVDFADLGNQLLIVAAVYAVSALLMWTQGFLMSGVTQRAVFALRRDVQTKLGRLPLTYFDRNSRGDVLSRVTNDIDNVATTLQQVLSQLINSLLTVVGVLGMMYWISPILATVSLVVVPASFAVTMAIAKRSQPQFVAQWDWTGKLNGHVEEMFTGHDLVKVFGQQQRAVTDFETINEQMYEASRKAQFVSGLIQPSMAFLGNLNYVAICVIGGLQVANGKMPLGDVQAFIQYSRQFTMPITQLASVANVLQSGIASAERVFELLDAEEQTPEPVDAPTLERAVGAVDLVNVAFRYVPEKPLIRNLNLQVLPGQEIAIVGPTGAGKTTMVNLLMRFYDIDDGLIALDGIDTRAMNRENLRSQFGMVLQDTWLFSGTIRENLAYGKLDATDEEIYAAARLANVDSFVRTLPDGYDTVLDDEATNLSAGEKQLLTIARAFLADPAVLILDEATSSVDTRTEVLIRQAMEQLRVGRTSFVIAHRLSTIRDADTILVMDAGDIVEQGSHDELIALGGVYAKLYESQFAGAE